MNDLEEALKIILNNLHKVSKETENSNIIAKERKILGSFIAHLIGLKIVKIKVLLELTSKKLIGYGLCLSFLKYM